VSVSHAPVRVGAPKRASRPRPPLWCFAGGGSPALALLPIARALPANQSVHALQAHGFEGRHRPDFSVRDAARRHLREIRHLAPVGPYPLVGHSFGGLIAFEVARMLTAAGEWVPFVMLLDTMVPKSLGGNGRTPEDAEETSPAAPPSLRRRWQMHLRVAGAGLVDFPPAVRDEVFWERSLRMANRYRPGPWSGRVVQLLAAHNSDDAELWSKVVTGELVVKRVAGGHSSMLRPPFNGQIIDQLNAELTMINADPDERDSSAS